MQKLIDDHKNAYEEMRSFFNNVISTNLDSIKKLKEDAAEAKRLQLAAEAHASEVAQENKQLVEPLAQVWIQPILNTKDQKYSQGL